jgi:hypothetical protein
MQLHDFLQSTLSEVSPQLLVIHEPGDRVCESAYSRFANDVSPPPTRRIRRYRVSERRIHEHGHPGRHIPGRFCGKRQPGESGGFAVEIKGENETVGLS